MAFSGVTSRVTFVGQGSKHKAWLSRALDSFPSSTALNRQRCLDSTALLLVKCDVFFRCLRCCFEVSSQGKIWLLFTQSPETLFSLVRPIQKPHRNALKLQNRLQIWVLCHLQGFPPVVPIWHYIPFCTPMMTCGIISFFCFPKWEYSSRNLLIDFTMFWCQNDSERAFSCIAVRELKQANAVKSCWNTPQQ